MVTEDRPGEAVPSRTLGQSSWRKSEGQGSAPWAGNQGLAQFWCC